MYFSKRVLISSLLTVSGTMPSNWSLGPSFEIARSIYYHQDNNADLTHPLRRIFLPNEFAPQNPLWPPPSSSSRRRMVHSTLSKTTNTSTPLPSKINTHYHSFQTLSTN